MEHHMEFVIEFYFSNTIRLCSNINVNIKLATQTFRVKSTLRYGFLFPSVYLLLAFLIVGVTAYFFQT